MEVLAAAAEREPLEIAVRLDGLTGAGGLLVAEKDGYRFAHSRYREALLERMSPKRRQLYHSHLVDKVVRLHPAESAYHVVQAGPVLQGIEALLQQGDQALELFDWKDALRYYQEALWLSWSDPGSGRSLR